MKEPTLHVWKKTKTSKPTTMICIYHFLALLYYFGIVSLPSKRDYWTTEKWMPNHSIVKSFDMSRERFEFLWRHFHIEDSNEVEEESEDESDDDEKNEDVGHERIQREQEFNNQSSDSEIEGIDDTDHATEGSEKTIDEKVVWFHKLTFFIKHVRNVSQNMVHVLGNVLYLHEMMIRFFVRSFETHRMKNRPIKEGFKFFVLATKSGYILNFTPDGRRAAQNGEQEYEDKDESGKVQSMIMFLISVQGRLRDSRRSTRSNKMMDKFYFAMDNYFTFPRVIAGLREKDIGVVGTARFRGKNWPPRELRDIKKEDVTFNKFFWMVDEFGTLIARWMDNGLVFCVSTIHKPGQIVKRRRKLPRVTMNNRKHVKEVWGDMSYPTSRSKPKPI